MYGRLVPKAPPTAQDLNSRAIALLQKRVDKEGSVLRYCIEDYLARPADTEEHPLDNLTRHLLSTFATTHASIRTRMEARHAGKANSAALIESSVRNSLMRSAGTNYQGLVTYALARFLRDSGSAWFVQHPVPKAFGQSLSIRFTGGVQVDPEEIQASADPDEDPLIDELIEEEDEVEDASVTVAPDVDILLQNAAWINQPDVPEPVLLLSVKTSLADRAGSAARWKNYFDIVTSPCAHVCEADCAYRRLGIELANTPNVAITHGIVTANIYKVNSDPKFAEFGELSTQQARSNTFMFELRYTTRNENEKVMAPGWDRLSQLPIWLGATSAANGLPG
jgi:hypothetical protein